jgi:hypothetical protein
MSAKHTPGPWVSNSDGSAIKAGKKIVADCIPEHPADRVAREQFLPNARLIAAAPEMLAALQLLLKDFRTEGCPDPKCLVCKASNAAELAALQAIAKAKGGDA